MYGHLRPCSFMTGHAPGSPLSSVVLHKSPLRPMLRPCALAGPRSGCRRLEGDVAEVQNGGHDLEHGQDHGVLVEAGVAGVAGRPETAAAVPHTAAHRHIVPAAARPRLPSRRRRMTPCPPLRTSVNTWSCR